MKHRSDRDEGLVLPMVLLITLGLGMWVVALAQYGTTSMRFGNVAEAREDRLAAADGAMRDAIEKLRVGRSMCATLLGDGSGYGTTFPEPINGASAKVNCQTLGRGAAAVTAWAVVITGEGVSSTGGAFTTQSGNGLDKKIGGPVYLESLSQVDVKAPVQIVEGDVYYAKAPTASCPIEGASTNLTIDNVLFDPPTVRGTICTQSTWKEIFGANGPALPATGFGPVRSWSDYTMVGNCRVFPPGTYTGDADLYDGGNYFQSGNYRFINTVFDPSTNGTRVTAGYPDSSANVFQGISNPDCDAARDADPYASTPGATFYMDGSSRVRVTKGAFEILPRLQGTSWVSMQALSGSDRTATNEPMIATQSGNKKEFSVAGLIWAPYAAFEIGNVTNEAVVALRGGAVVAAIDIGASASITGFVIQVPTSPVTQTLLLTSTATLNGVTTTIKAVVEYRAPKEVAVVSWRVANGT